MFKVLNNLNEILNILEYPEKVLIRIVMRISGGQSWFFCLAYFCTFFILAKFAAWLLSNLSPLPVWQELLRCTAYFFLKSLKKRNCKMNMRQRALAWYFSTPCVWMMPTGIALPDKAHYTPSDAAPPYTRTVNTVLVDYIFFNKKRTGIHSPSRAQRFLLLCFWFEQKEVSSLIPPPSRTLTQVTFLRTKQWWVLDGGRSPPRAVGSPPPRMPPWPP